MAVIWKFTVERHRDGKPAEGTNIALPNAYVKAPRQTTFLSVGTEGDNIVLWGMVPDKSEPLEQHFLCIVPTGAEFNVEPMGWRARVDSLIGRVSFPSPFGTLQFHVFKEH